MKRGFTLIELLAVIVILAIIALIATPIVLNIIKDSRESANQRSIELYAQAVENAVADYMITNPQKTPSFKDIKDDIAKYYTGSPINSDGLIYPGGKIYLYNISVNNSTETKEYGTFKTYYKCATDCSVGDTVKLGNKTEDYYVYQNNNNNLKLLSTERVQSSKIQNKLTELENMKAVTSDTTIEGMTKEIAMGILGIDSIGYDYRLNLITSDWRYDYFQTIMTSENSYVINVINAPDYQEVGSTYIIYNLPNNFVYMATSSPQDNPPIIYILTIKK